MPLLDGKMLPLATLLVVGFAVMDMANGNCCSTVYGYVQGRVVGYCGDCTLGTPHCGYGQCNALGCNCGGCRNINGQHCTISLTDNWCRCPNYSFPVGHSYSGMGQGFPVGGRRRRSVRSAAEESSLDKFTGLDTNKNGVMEKLEFEKALESMNITDEMAIVQHWTLMDENKDGVITLGEFDDDNK